MKKHFLLINLVLLSFILKAQNTYNILFDSPQSDEVGWFVYNDKQNDQQIVLLSYECYNDEPDCAGRQFVYTITNEGDTIRWPFADRRNDTMFSINNLVSDENGDYFAVGLGWTKDSTGSTKNAFDYITKWDNTHNLIWENLHNRPEEYNPITATTHFKIMELMNGNYLVGMTVETIVPFDISYYLLEFSPDEGTILKEKVIHLGGNSFIQSLTYNFDSSAIMLHSGRTYMPECERHTEGIIFLNASTYDTIGTYCYNRDNDDPQKYWCVSQPYNAKFNKEGKLIVAGTGSCTNMIEGTFDHYLFAYEYDSNFQLSNRKFLTDKDIRIDAAWYESLDINENDEILLVGNHDRQIGPWCSINSYIYIAKLDKNLELLNERYIGGDAYYTVYSMAATSDGGIVATGTRFDYLVNDYERDAFIIKTDGGLWLDIPQVNEENVHRALVYPNPGSDELNIRTTVSESIFRLYNLNGALLIEQPVNALITTIITSSLPQGAYWWTLTQHGQLADKGKWIKY